MKRRIAIGQQEKRIEDQKTRTLEDRKSAAPDRFPKIKADQSCLTRRQPQLGVILSEAKNLSVTINATARTIACEANLK